MKKSLIIDIWNLYSNNILKERGLNWDYSKFDWITKGILKLSKEESTKKSSSASKSYFAEHSFNIYENFKKRDKKVIEKNEDDREFNEEMDECSFDENDTDDFSQYFKVPSRRKLQKIN